MSFKHDGKKSYQWQNWVATHRRELCEGGVPDAVLKTEYHWIRFLEEGCDYASGWNSEMLSLSQTQTLHAFIYREYGNERYRGFLRELEVILKSTKHE
jgi:hypothetical protein